MQVILHNSAGSPAGSLIDRACISCEFCCVCLPDPPLEVGDPAAALLSPALGDDEMPVNAVLS